MDTALWPQGIGAVKPMEGSTRAIADERKPRPQKEQALNCPRCNSTNTKFCYYNNYSLSQPRYFCKTCRRYWTEGGSLRNVPVGGGSRKNKRSSPASSSKKLPDLMTHQSPKIREVQDLNLAYPPSASDYNNINPNSSSHYLSAMELLKSSTGNISSRGLSSFMPISVGDHGNNTIYQSGFPPQEFKPSLNFSLDGFENLNQMEGVQEGTSASARPFFPFEDLKLQAPTTVDHEFEQINRAQGASTGYWTGMLGGGSSW